MNKVEQRFLKDLANELEVDTRTIDDSFSLMGDSWDSVTVISTVALIDDHFDVSVEGSELEDCENVGQVLSLIRQALDS